MQAMLDPSSNQADKGLWHRWRPWLIVCLVVIATLALLALALVILPPMLVPPGKANFAELAKAESDIRGNLVATLGVLAVLIGGAVGFLNFHQTQRQNRLARQQDREQLELARRGQVSERFSKAIEQLGQSGDDKVDVRVGAIYSLEQIARDSPEELHGPIVDCVPPGTLASSRTKARTTPPGGWTGDRNGRATVLGRRDVRRDTRHLDLTGVEVRGVILVEARFEKANLVGVRLERGALPGANLEGADLRVAHLEKAKLDGAHLEEADLRGAHLGT
jgi:Pentapeptide repeats (8 copies)